MIVSILLSAGGMAGGFLQTSLESAPDRQAIVARAGAAVMPFDLDRTQHRFDKRPGGGVQGVLSKDGDAEQIGLIREHLRAEAVRFAVGQFASPAAIHGSDMPGLKRLATHSGGLDVVYADVPRGGEIRFTSADPALITALHEWFDAQLADHGSHATGTPHDHHFYGELLQQPFKED